MEKQSAPSIVTDRTRLIQDELEQVKQQTVLLAIPGLFISALILGSIIPQLDEYQWALSAAILLLSFIPIIWYLSSKNFTMASILLCISYTLAVIITIFWGGFPEAVIFLIIPIGLTSFIFGTPLGILCAVCSTVLIILAPEQISDLNASMRLCTLIIMWAVVGMIWLTMRPLLAALNWYWDEFHQSQNWLNQARDYQVKLHQALDELTHANTQLKRLNTIANDLRQVANEERKTKEQFVANVSHELRTPLNMIIGYCEMILRLPDSYGNKIPGKLLADLQVVLRNSQHLSSLIDDVLDLSQIEAGQMALVREWVQISEIIDAVVVAVRPLFEKKKIYLKTDIQENLPEVYCDRTRIREVLLNLLSNAGRFTEKGGVTLRVWQERKDIYFSVNDTGPGIADMDKGKLFQPFQQLDASIRRRHGGTGLGLSISKSFVEMHDGKMTVESEVGVGTTLTFYIPLEPHIMKPEGYSRWLNPYMPYEKPLRQTSLPLIDSRPKILVVEGGSVMQRFLNRYMPDVEIAGVSDLAKAKLDLEESPARIVVINETQSDLVSGGLVKVDSLPNHVPVIFCSVSEQTADVLTGDIVDVLVKPISHDALIEAIGKLDSSIQTILIVDDEPEIQNLFLRILVSTNKKYQVLRSDNARQAIHLLERKKVDVILLDIIMPEMDGFEFLKRKSENPDWRDIPVILISARDPKDQPIISHFLAVTQKNGLSAQQVLSGIQSLSALLIPSGLGNHPPK